MQMIFTRCASGFRKVFHGIDMAHAIRHGSPNPLKEAHR